MIPYMRQLLVSQPTNIIINVGKSTFELVIPVIVALQCDDHPFHSIDFEWRIDWSTLKMLNFGTFGL